MTAPVLPTVPNSNRARLEQVIPLSTPYKIYIDPSSVCNFGCQFCPHSAPALYRRVQPKHGIMSLDLFRSILDDISKFDRKIKMIELYSYGDPLMNPHISEIACELVRASVAERTRIKSNGALLTQQLAESLAAAQLDMILFSVLSSDEEEYRRISGRKVNYAALVDNIGRLYSMRGKTRIYVKIIKDYFTSAGMDKLRDDFGDKCDFIVTEKLYGINRTDLKDFYMGKPRKLSGDAVVCPYPFYQLTVNWDGEVSSCCVDWTRNIIFGNVKSEHLKDIWNGSTLREFQRMQLQGRRTENKSCATCDFIQENRIDNIDSYRKEILDKLPH